MYTEVDKIFQLIGANRAHYFGRAFEGVDIKKIMAKSDDLFGVGGTLRQNLLQHTSHPDKVVIVNKVCDDVGLAFKLWDGVFSAIHLPNPTVEHCMETQDRIDKAMAHTRSMGFSVSPKMHGMESDVVRRMITIPGGELESSWSIGSNSTIKPVLGLTWLIVALDLSWDKQQFDQAQKREHTTHESS